MNPETLRVLVVDDETGIREGCRQILTMEGYAVDVAEDGRAGLKLFEERRNYAVALIDLKMPGMSGLELIEQLRARDEDLVMFVITAYATFETAVEATKQGAYGYIPKPFTPDELLLPLKRGVEARALSLEAKRLREERANRLLEVAREKSKSSTIIKCMTDGVLVINRDRQIVLWNEAARRILPGCEILSLPAPVNALAGAEDLIVLLNETVNAGSEPVIVSQEITLGKKVYMVNVSPVSEPGSGPAGAVAVLRDITALKELESAKSLFVSMVAHEVKRPLGVIEGYLSLLRDGMIGADPQKQKEILERSLSRARTLRIMVSELMNLTALETGKFNLKRKPLDLTAVIEEAAESCREKAREKRIELAVEGRGTGIREPVLADQEALLIVFTNLLDNAIKYTPEQGRVQVQVRDAGHSVQVAVQDNGIGMTPEEQERIFEEFYRARNKYTAKVPGTGLGLSLVQRLVEAHQGKILVESAPGQGSTFRVFLPKPETPGHE